MYPLFARRKRYKSVVTKARAYKRKYKVSEEELQSRYKRYNLSYKTRKDFETAKDYQKYLKTQVDVISGRYERRKKKIFIDNYKKALDYAGVNPDLRDKGINKLRHSRKYKEYLDDIVFRTANQRDASRLMNRQTLESQPPEDRLPKINYFYVDDQDAVDELEERLVATFLTEKEMEELGY